MTICIAALCDDEKGCVLTSDQMVTAHFPIGYEFENEEVEKIAKISDSSYVLIAGDIVFANRIVEDTKTQIKSQNIISIHRIAEQLRVSYQNIRKMHIIQTEIEPRGIDINYYYANQQRLLPHLVQVIDNQLRNFPLTVDFIIVGQEESSCHIYTVGNPGLLLSHDCIGFAAIGSGAPHAIYSLIESKYKKSLNKESVKEIVDKAKKRSEVAPGVGGKTTQKII